MDDLSTDAKLVAEGLYHAAMSIRQIDQIRELITIAMKEAKLTYGLPQGLDEPDNPEEHTTAIGKFAAHWDEYDRTIRKIADE
jgi:hypothetical protein